MRTHLLSIANEPSLQLLQRSHDSVLPDLPIDDLVDLLHVFRQDLLRHDGRRFVDDVLYKGDEVLSCRRRRRSDERVEDGDVGFRALALVSEMSFSWSV